MQEIYFDINTGCAIDGNVVTLANKRIFNLICLKCSSEVFLRGENFIHKDKTCTNQDIKMARTKLVNYIKTGGNIVIRCNMCSSTKVLNLNNTTIKIKYIIAKRVVSIVIMDSSNNIRYVLDMHYTHGVNTKVEKWSEFRPHNVIKALSNPGKTATLIDIKRCTCARKAKTMRELAIELGYCTVFDEWSLPQRRVAILAKPGNSYKITYTWKLTFALEIRGYTWMESWMEFASRNCCLKCNIATKITIGRPFCASCRSIIATDGVETTVVPLCRNTLDIFERHFKWLTHLPNTGEVKSGECYSCKLIKYYIWYYGTRPICINCVVKSHNELFSHEGFFSSSSDKLDVILANYDMYKA